MVNGGSGMEWRKEWLWLERYIVLEFNGNEGSIEELCSLILDPPGNVQNAKEMLEKSLRELSINYQHSIPIE